MQPDIQPLCGLAFTHPDTAEQYGPIRSCESEQIHPAKRGDWTPVAADDCGNAFIVSRDGIVSFWDHETDEITHLASDWTVFSEGCAKPRLPELDPLQVRSVWVDPAFAEEHGIDVPKDGRKKKP